MLLFFPKIMPASKRGELRQRKVALKKALPLLHAVCRMNEKERNSLLQYINFRGRDILYQCIRNCVYSPRLSKSQRAEIRTKLKSKARTYKYLSNPENTDAKKKKLLRAQVGAGLDTVLSSVLPLLETILPN